MLMFSGNSQPLALFLQYSSTALIRNVCLAALLSSSLLVPLLIGQPPAPLTFHSAYFLLAFSLYSPFGEKDDARRFVPAHTEPPANLSQLSIQLGYPTQD